MLLKFRNYSEQILNFLEKSARSISQNRAFFPVFVSWWMLLSVFFTCFADFREQWLRIQLINVKLVFHNVKLMFFMFKT